MTALPSSLALTSIADDAEIIAADHRNNYASIQTAVNDIIAALAAGSSGQILTSGGASAVSWAAAPAITEIFDVVVGRGQSGDPAAPASVIDSNTILGGNISSSYRHLSLLIKGKSDQASVQNVLMRINNVSTGSLYYWQDGYDSATSRTSAEGIAQNELRVGYAGASAGAGFAADISIPNYNDTSYAPMVQSSYFSAHNNSTGTLRAGRAAGVYSTVGAVTRIQLLLSTGNFASGTRATLYGLT